MARNTVVPQHYYNKSAASRNLGAPSNIKCCRCDKVKASTAYSSVKLHEVTEWLRKEAKHNINPAKTARVPCTSCTPTQNVEMQCFRCDKWMGLNQFAKSQRKNPDHAECERCVEERGNMEPRVDSDDPFSDADNGSNDSQDDDSGGEDYALRLPSAAPPGVSIKGSSATYHSTSSQQGGVSLIATSSKCSTAPSSVRSSNGASTRRRDSIDSTTTASTVTVMDNRKFAKPETNGKKQSDKKKREEEQRMRRLQEDVNRIDLDRVQVEDSDSDSDD